jgi:hypothetical protein
MVGIRGLYPWTVGGLMKYIDARPNIKSGDLLAWSHRTVRNWHDFKILMVRMFTRSEYSHVGTAWVVGGRVLVIEAVQPKVRIYPLSKLGDFYLLKMGAPWKPETEEKALFHVGDDYSEVVALRAFFDQLPVDTTSECAALVLTITKADGIDLGRRATPDAVVLAAQKLGAITTYISNPEIVE